MLFLNIAHENTTVSRRPSGELIATPSVCSIPVSWHTAAETRQEKLINFSCSMAGYMNFISKGFLKQFTVKLDRSAVILKSNVEASLVLDFTGL